MQAASVERAIRNFVNEAEQKAARLNLQQLEKQRYVLSLINRQAEIYQRMAVIFLQDSPDVKNVSDIQSLLKQLKQELSVLEGRYQNLKYSMSQCRTHHDEIINGIRALEGERDNRLAKDDAFAQFITGFFEVRQEYEDVKRLHQEQKAEFEEKLAEYDKEPRYDYLIKRRFGEADYKGKWIFRNLDSWLARQVNFGENRKNQQMLIALLNHSTERYLEVKMRYQKRLEERDRQITYVESDLGLSPLRKKLEELKAQFSRYQRESDEVFDELKANRDGHGSKFMQIAEQLSEVMKRLPLKKLDSLVLMTRSPEDEALLAELVKLKSAIDIEEKNIDELQTSYRNYQKMQDNLHQVSNLFQREFMGQRCEYNITPRVLDDLLEKAMTGRTPPQSVINYLFRRLILQEVKRDYERRSSPSGFDGFFGSGSRSSGRSSSRSGGFSSGSSSGGGGFSTSSSSGGGKFRTTDSF